MRLIDADALLEQWSEVYTDVETWHRCIEISTVKAQPTIEAVPVVQGEWIEADDLEGAIKGSVVCSNCKNPFESIVMTNEMIILTNQKTKYCPNCGAKMDGKERRDEQEI